MCWIFDVDILILSTMFCQLKELNSPEDDIRTSFKSNVYSVTPIPTDQHPDLSW